MEMGFYGIFFELTVISASIQKHRSSVACVEVFRQNPLCRQNKVNALKHDALLHLMILYG